MEYGIDLHLLFVDFKQAFDSINRSKIARILTDFKIPIKLTNLVLITLANTTAKIMLQGDSTDEFEIRSGVRQRNELSTTIFNLVLHSAIKDLYQRGHIINKSYQIYAYADDIVIVARNIHSMKEVFVIVAGDKANGTNHK